MEHIRSRKSSESKTIYNVCIVAGELERLAQELDLLGLLFTSIEAVLPAACTSSLALDCPVLFWPVLAPVNMWYALRQTVELKQATIT